MRVPPSLCVCAVLLGALLAIVPTPAGFRVPVTATVPLWVYALFRIQLGAVYLFAAVAKFTPDWLVFGQPLGIWLRARTDIPLFGPVFAKPETALAMSWAGFLYDLTITGFLLDRRTRRWAYAVVLVFHALTSVLFDIGLFPFIMTIGTTMFFDPSWPRRVLGFFSAKVRAMGTPQRRLPVETLSPAKTAFVALFVAANVLIPLRGFLTTGPIIWHEQGMRYSWRVMVREKAGAVTYTVTQRTPPAGEKPRRWVVSPTEYLTWRQAMEFSGQPDLIVQLAHHIADEFDSRGLGPVEVRAEALVSLNGRPPALLIDPGVDLTRVDENAFALTGPPGWIKPLPPFKPLPLRRADDTTPRVAAQR